MCLCNCVYICVHENTSQIFWWSFITYSIFICSFVSMVEGHVWRLEVNLQKSFHWCGFQGSISAVRLRGRCFHPLAQFSPVLSTSFLSPVVLIRKDGSSSSFLDVKIKTMTSDSWTLLYETAHTTSIPMGKKRGINICHLGFSKRKWSSFPFLKAHKNTHSRQSTHIHKLNAFKITNH